VNKSFILAKLLGVEVGRPDGPSLQPTASSLIAKWGQSKGLLAAHVPKTRGSCGSLYVAYGHYGGFQHFNVIFSQNFISFHYFEDYLITKLTFRVR
jgi:hypothetical protein